MNTLKKLLEHNTECFVYTLKHLLENDNLIKELKYVVYNDDYYHGLEDVEHKKEPVNILVSKDDNIDEKNLSEGCWNILLMTGSVFNTLSVEDKICCLSIKEHSKALWVSRKLGIKIPMGHILEKQEKYAIASLDSSEQLMMKKATQLRYTRNLIQLFKSKIDDMSKIEKKDDNLVFKFENIVCKDTDGEGEDIEIENIEWYINVIEKTYFIDGFDTYKTEFNERACHPHQMSDNTFCMGSLSSDFENALDNYNFNELKAICHKLSSTYTSIDDAGKYYKLWLGETVEGDCYSEIDDCYYEEDECVYVESRETYVYKDDVVYDGYGDPQYYEDVVEDYEGVFYHGEDTYYCTEEEVYIRKDDAILLYDYEYCTPELEIKELTIGYYKGKYAPIEETVEVVDEEGDTRICLREEVEEDEEGMKRYVG